MSSLAVETRSPRDAGFTLIEITVVMGLLAVIFAALVQITGQGAEVWRRGERGQELADRALAAGRAARTALESIAGPRPGWRGGEPGTPQLPDARFLLHDAPFGSRSPESAPRDNGSEAAPTVPNRVQVLRSSCLLEPAREEQLLVDAVRAFLERTEGVAVTDELVAEQLAAWPRRGRGELLVLPWPADEAGVFLDLRVGERLADPELRLPSELGVAEIASVEDLALAPALVLASTRVVASGLLHFGIECWSQRTQSWTDALGRGGETRWDSARAGLLARPADAGAADAGFALDLSEASRLDPRDDVWPRWLRVTIVVAGAREVPPEGYLADPLSAEDQQLRVTRADDLPDAADQPWLKVDGEWVRFASRDGELVTGLRRAQRGTQAVDHARGAAVRVGREIVLQVPLRAGRDTDD
jgi:prepilin-type N-terminal cleavage/methylation domain-containing protein